MAIFEGRIEGAHMAGKTLGTEWPRETGLGELVSELHSIRLQATRHENSRLALLAHDAWAGMYALALAYAGDIEFAAIFLMMASLDLEHGFQMPANAARHLASLINAALSNPSGARKSLGLGTRGAPKRDARERDKRIFDAVEALRKGAPLSSNAQGHGVFDAVGEKFALTGKRVEQIYAERRRLAEAVQSFVNLREQISVEKRNP